MRYLSSRTVPDHARMMGTVLRDVLWLSLKEEIYVQT